MKFKTLGVAALLVLCAVAPALAGSVYVPAATDRVVDGVRYQTQVWVTNHDEDLRQFTSYFIPTESDGTERPENWGDASAIPAGGTMLLGSVAGSGETGMLEISGAPHIVVTARMVATKDGVTGLGAAIPVISSKNLFAADTVAHNQGWVRSGDLRSDFGLVNLGSEETTCSIRVLRNSGSQIQNTAVITVPPLTQRQFNDALAILGVQAISAVRSETSCDQPFYSYLRTYERTTGDVTLSLPTHTIGESTLNPPGTEQPAPGCSAGAAYCFQQPGVFFAPTRSEPVKFIDAHAPAGFYSRLRVAYDILHGGWYPQRPHGAHNLLWIARNRRHFDLFGYVNIFGPGRSEIIWRHGIAQAHEAKAKISAPAVMMPGQLYRLEYIYDTNARTIDLVITNSQGQAVVDLNDRPNTQTVRVDAGDPYSLGLGFYEGENPNEVPTYGWQYRNLVIEFFD